MSGRYSHESESATGVLVVRACLLFRGNLVVISAADSVWLLYPSLPVLPFSPVAVLQTFSVWVIPFKM